MGRWIQDESPGGDSAVAAIEARLAALESGLAGLVAAQEQAAQPNYVERGTQQLLAMQYRRDAAAGVVHDFGSVEFRNHSQNGEDGILHYLFSVIGTTSRYVVEMCAGNGRECNAANLIINHGWHALLCDGSEENIRIANDFYWRHPDTMRIPPAICQAWLTAENVNEVIARYGFDREIDLLSIDVDGNDYWLWRAITAANPRVVIIEIQAGWMADAAVTVPYDPQFCVRKLVDPVLQTDVDYCGASLPAMVKLGREKGYRLVGANRYGFNVVFVRNDIAAELLPEIPAEQCFGHPVARWQYGRVQPLLRREAWVEV
ncbi:MAG: hypothetical protein IPO20_11075 [Gammaproteobacteria bacterium]|nr:hypothetical protein [Gammaproteobacteria bacterium]